MKHVTLINLLVSLLVMSANAKTSVKAQVSTKTKIVVAGKPIRFFVNVVNNGTEAILLPEAIDYKNGRMLPSVSILVSKKGKSTTMYTTSKVFGQGPKGSVIGYTKDSLEPGNSSSLYFEWTPSQNDIGNIELIITLPKSLATKNIIQKITVTKNKKANKAQ